MLTRLDLLRPEDPGITAFRAIVNSTLAVHRRIGRIWDFVCRLNAMADGMDSLVSDLQPYFQE
jgi:hypothetical protein